MLGLLLGVIFAAAALQNTQYVTLHFQNYVTSVPLYLVAIASMLVGVIVTATIALVGALSSSLSMFGKDIHIKSTENALQRLENKIHDLEIENARLKGTKGEAHFMKQSAFDKPNVFQKIRHRLSV